MADTSSLTDQRLKSSLFDSERAGMLAVLAVIGEVPIYLRSNPWVACRAATPAADATRLIEPVIAAMQLLILHAFDPRSVQADGELMEDSNPLQRTIILSRVVGYAQGLCNQINDVRASRRSAFLSAYPIIHWLLLVALGFTIPSLFIVLASTAKGATVELLSDELIRVLFAALATSITSLLVLLADLNDPYAGNYAVGDGRGFELPRQQIYAALAELQSDEPAMRAEHERLARMAVARPDLLATAKPPDALALKLRRARSPRSEPEVT